MHEDIWVPYVGSGGFKGKAGAGTHSWNHN